jgi:hypothetical protein
MWGGGVLATGHFTIPPTSPLHAGGNNTRALFGFRLFRFLTELLTAYRAPPSPKGVCPFRDSPRFLGYAQHWDHRKFMVRCLSSSTSASPTVRCLALSLASFFRVEEQWEQTVLLWPASALCLWAPCNAPFASRRAPFKCHGGSERRADCLQQLIQRPLAVPAQPVRPAAFGGEGGGGGGLCERLAKLVNINSMV